MTVQNSIRALPDYECLPFHCDWLGSDLRIGHFFSLGCPLVNTPQLNTQLLLRTNPIEFTNELSFSPRSIFISSSDLRLGLPRWLCSSGFPTKTLYAVLLKDIGRCYDIIVVNVYAPTEDKTDDRKDGCYEELAHILWLLSAECMAKSQLKDS
jgi:hypothetical protein